ncbi:hypothetical protein ACIHCX_23360 [Streptomyces sp. NPDC052043]|uniref:hypothetical protein n=1 Tax=Streptomyces sp. NPDC052043 TaxID=3365684 RepID=UPI0037D6DCCB
MGDVDYKGNDALREIDAFTEFGTRIKNEVKVDYECANLVTFADFPHVHSYGKVGRSTSSSTTAGTTRSSRTSLFHAKLHASRPDLQESHAAYVEGYTDKKLRRAISVTKSAHD